LNAAQRKEYPLYSGVIAYFRDALLRVAHVSYVGNQQHNPGEPLHWARGKSTDQLDCVARHLASCAGEEAHKAAMAWRALADLQLYLEQKYNIMPPPNAKDPDNTTFHHPV
jgi:hypothetical protein